MKIEEYIKNEENIISFRNNVLLLKQDEMFEVLDVMENNDFKKLYESNIEENAKSQFNIASNITPKLIVFREDKAGYPNNQSLIGFSLKEKPSSPDFIVYYEYNKYEKILIREEAHKDFIKNTLSKIENYTNKITLEKELEKYFFNFEELKSIRFPKILFEDISDEKADNLRKEEIIKNIKEFKNKDIDYDFSM